MQNDVSTQRINSAVLLINWILNAFLVLGYIAEYFKGGKTLGFVAEFLVIVLIPLTLATALYFKDRANRYVKFITITGYFIMYVFAMFTSTRLLVYTYVFPILAMYMLYFDLRFVVLSCIAATAANVAKITWDAAFLGLRDANSTTDYTIQLATILLYSLSLIMTTRLSNRLNSEKIKSISEEKEKQGVMMEDILKISAVLDSNSRKVHEIIRNLSSSTSTITNAVSLIADGADKTAASIQQQSAMTHNIHDIINETSLSSQNTRNKTDETVRIIREGYGAVSKLNDMASAVKENSDNAYVIMSELKEKSHDIQGIADMISGISEQTNLLSLNASIESARAGEAGRGFAVVADEIRKLAVQSRESTTEIASILSELEEKADSSGNAVLKLKEVNAEQNELIVRTKTVFDTIMSHITEVSENIGSMNDRINEILRSNNLIIETISAISAVSEQTTNNAREAGTMVSLNTEQAELAERLAEELIETSKDMEKYRS